MNPASTRIARLSAIGLVVVGLVAACSSSRSLDTRSRPRESFVTFNLDENASLAEPDSLAEAILGPGDTPPVAPRSGICSNRRRVTEDRLAARSS